MARTIHFHHPDGGDVWVEVDEPGPEGSVGSVGVGPVGIADHVRQTVTEVERWVEQDLQRTLRHQAEIVLGAVQELPDPPTELEISFGLKITAEGNVVVSKAGLEGHYSIKLVWKRTP